jgi:integrase
MASIHKDPRGKSPFWYCAFYGADGRRMFRSTKETDRKKALKICLAWESASVKARRKELTAAQARKVIAEMVAVSSGENLEFFTVSQWMEQWLANKTGGASANTILRYRQVVRDFLASLGSRAKASLAGVSPGDIVSFRDKLRSEGRAVSTCNMVVKKVLSVPFEAARKMGYLPTNPVAAVDLLKDKAETRKSGREPFTPDEISQLVTAASEEDWRGAVLLAATSGLRLRDVASLTWGAIDFEEGLLRTETEKTGAVVVLPVHPDFMAWLADRPRGIGKAFVFPTLAGKRIGGCSGLSAQFRKIIEAAGITGRVIERTGKGRTGHSKGFHSLRHSFISGLANAGVSPDVRQKLAGHADARVHAGYTHHEIETLRAAIGKLPGLRNA